jgi:hypothetical protein
MDWALPPELADVPGATELFDWFGYWPTLHDAELVDIVLNTQGASWIGVYTCGFTGEVHPSGHYVQIKHVTVKFILEGISKLELQDFSIQNVMCGVFLTRSEDGYEIELEPIYGIGGTVSANRVRIEIEPGILPNRPGFSTANDV